MDLKVGDLVIFEKENIKEVGVIKKIDSSKNSAYVWYYINEISTTTNIEDLKKFNEKHLSFIQNKFAYETLKERSEKIKKQEYKKYLKNLIFKKV